MIDHDDDNINDGGRFDEWLRETAAELHVPPPTPRDAMWERIQARRQAAAPASAPVAPVAPAVTGPGPESPAAPRVLPFVPRRRPWLWPTAVAAALLLGVALDRALLRRTDDAPSSQLARTDDTARGVEIGRTDRAASAPEVDGPATTVASSDKGNGKPKTSGTSERAAGSPTDAPPQRVAMSDPRPAPTTRPGPRERLATPAPDAQQLYRVVAVQTLSQAEALLTAYRTSDATVQDSAAMRRLGGWARDVLTSTRLLIDSPAARDPQLGRLLDDLELVLVQLVQLSGAPLTEEDRTLIDRALRDRDLLPRLRTAVPAGAQSTS